MIRDRLTCRRGRAAAVGAVLLCMGAACHGDSAAPPPASEGGTYALVSVNGQALPATISNTAAGTVVIQSATLDLVPGASSSTYTAVVTGTEGGEPSQAIISDAGTYVRSGSTITFTSSVASGLAYAGSLNGTSLTVGVPGVAIGASGTLSLLLHRS